jgi:hypothetical protein
MDSNLFGQKTIEKMCFNLSVTPKQTKACKEWLDLLKNDSLKEETKNYLRFAQIIMDDLLGYPIKSMEHEEKNVEFSFNDDNGKTLIIVEAKGTEQNLFESQHREKKDQETPIDQLWSYMSREAIPFGIATNYSEFVLLHYAKGNKKHHIFKFFDIEKNAQKLKEFIAVFSQDSIKKGFVEKLEEESILEEREFTKEFYKLFHETRLMLIKEYNEQNDEESSVHYAQIFLNRLMFTLFAEDSDKLPKHIIEKRIISLLSNLNLFSSNSSQVSNMITTLFADLDEGSDFPETIFGFNGGLFKEHIPQTISFKDFREEKYFKEVYQHSTLIKKKQLSLNEKEQEIFNKYKNKISPIIRNILLMASFDFNSEVNVNILGHIFEQSITDLEKIKEGNVSKRKKDGIYYTPEYITDYICRHTIIPYLSKGKAKSAQELVFEYLEDIDVLERKFHDLRILDPACGSGAFLIKAVDVLLEIHKEIQLFKQNKGDYLAVKKGAKKKKDISQMTLTKWHEEDEARKIIEQNIFGVDLNPESVEITRLSLFLKIAKKNRKLIDLSQNIRCGNSVVDDDAIDPRAFHWQKEFPFKFSIIIGNPPYVRQERISNIKNHLKKYSSYDGRADLYVYFYEQSINSIEDAGVIGFISSNKWMKTKYGAGMRLILKTKRLMELIDFYEQKVFEDASTEPIIVIFQNSRPEKKSIDVSTVDTLNFKEFDEYISKRMHKLNPDLLENDDWNLQAEKSSDIIDKLRENTITLKDYTNNRVFYGIRSGLVDAFIISPTQAELLIKEDSRNREVIKPLLEGTDIERYGYRPTNLFLIISKFQGHKEFQIKYPSVVNYLKKFESDLKKRGQVQAGQHHWLELDNNPNEEYLSLFEKPKIAYIYTAKEHQFHLDTENQYLTNNCYFISSSDLYLLAFLNSSIFKYYKICKFVAYGDAESRGRCKLDYNKMLKVPIKPIDQKKKEIIEPLVKDIMICKKNMNYTKQNFLGRIMTLNQSSKIPNKINNFEKLSFSDFFKELKKLTKKQFNLKEEEMWQEYFEEKKKETQRYATEYDLLYNKIEDFMYSIYDKLTAADRKSIFEEIGSQN